MEVESKWPIWPRAVDQELEPAAQPFKDVLDGLTVLYEDPFILDIRNTMLRYPDSVLGTALNKKQTACKKWALEELSDACGPKFREVHILAGWYGLLGAMMLHQLDFTIDKLTVIDRDPACEEVALSLNATHVERGRFSYRIHDIYELDYANLPDGLDQPDLIVNTSCEHLDNFGEWYEKMPEDVLFLLQSNNYRIIPEHVNCVDTLEDFKAQTPMSDRLFAGSLTLPKYTRFMVIGYK